MVDSNQRTTIVTESFRMVVNTRNGREGKTTEKCLSELQIYFRKFTSDKSGTFDLQKYQEIRLLYMLMEFFCVSL